MPDKQAILNGLQDSLNRSELPLESAYAYDMEAASELLAIRAKRLSQLIVNTKELEEVPFLFFDCAGQSFAIEPSASHGFIQEASIYAIPTLTSKGISLVIFNGQQLPVFDLDVNRKFDGVISASLLVIGREKAEFCIVVEKNVELESALISSFMECEFDQMCPLMSSVVAINNNGRKLISSEKLMGSDYFYLAE